MLEFHDMHWDQLPAHAAKDWQVTLANSSSQWIHFTTSSRIIPLQRKWDHHIIGIIIKIIPTNQKNRALLMWMLPNSHQILQTWWCSLLFERVWGYLTNAQLSCNSVTLEFLSTGFEWGQNAGGLHWSRSNHSTQAQVLKSDNFINFSFYVFLHCRMLSILAKIYDILDLMIAFQLNRTFCRELVDFYSLWFSINGCFYMHTTSIISFHLWWCMLRDSVGMWMN